MLKVGIFGAGHLGKIHIQQWKEIAGVEIVGFYDPDDEQAATAIAQYPVPRYKDIEQLLHSVDAVDIVSPTTTHHELAKFCLLNGKHVFIEKPLAHTLEEARELMKLVNEANVKCQVGHVERYNPALLALGDQPLQPMSAQSS